jgi:Cd2+/Zn2+-exporting ATPase/Cu+-exporting ATPase
MSNNQTIEIPVQGMDCAECTRHVQAAISEVQGVSSVDVFLATEKAVVSLDPNQTELSAIRSAVARAGYSVPSEPQDDQTTSTQVSFTRPILALLSVVFGIVLFIIIVGEWLGLFETITDRVPFMIGIALVVIAGFPVFRKVIQAALNKQIISHTLMTLGVLAALAVGEWVTALVVVFFMRVGDYIERFTAERARRAVKDLVTLAPQTARLEQGTQVIEVVISQVKPHDVVVVRPGEKIPVDGEVISGHAYIDQATITGESMPIEAGPGTYVFASTFAHQGSLRIRTVHIGPDTTFGRVIKLVEQAEANRGDIQRVADKFSTYYLPVVASIAALTLILRQDPMATAAVLVVACSCAFALATPIAMLASIGAGARHGVMIKGGKYLELLDQADVLLIDKTGTITLGRPVITNIISEGNNRQYLEEFLPTNRRNKLVSEFNNNQVIVDRNQSLRIEESQLIILYYAASAEKYSEHPLAAAVRSAAIDYGLTLGQPERFKSLPGQGIQTIVDGIQVTIGNRSFIESALSHSAAEDLENQGHTLLFVALDGKYVGFLAATDTLRSEVPQAIDEIRSLGIKKIELLTGDNQHSGSKLAEQIGVPYRAELMPEDKIAIVKDYQSMGHTVVMVGDGVNDAPALAQANVGIAIGTAQSDIALEAAHIALMRDDWSLVPEVIRIAHRTIRVVKMNIGFTTLYNFVGLSLAALGVLPPIMAAAAQSIPDLGILANSSRLLRQK